MDIPKSITEYAKENGLKVGVCNADSFEEIRGETEKTHSILVGFSERDIEKRINPRLTMEDCKSIICIAKRFDIEYDFERDEKIRGYISMGAIGDDYHIYMRKCGEEIAEILRDEFGGKTMVFCDTGPLNDRAVAKRCGIGHIGKSGNIVNEEFGSAMFLAYIMTDIEIECSTESENTCGNCRKCIESCPTGAISENDFEIEKCISYLTQVKRILSKEEIKAIGKNIYGCDICQRVCVRGEYNSAERNIDVAMPEIEGLLNMTNREFNEKYGRTAMGWRGLGTIKRNAVCVLSQYKNDEKAFELTEKMAKCENEIIRDTAEKVVEIMKERKEV